MKTLALFASLIAVPLFTFAQTLQERVDVDIVLVDATVTDARGNQILGLGPDDFVVRENGVEQKIESVDYFTNRRLLTSPEKDAAFKVERVREERYFVLFFDESGGSPAMGRLIRAQKDAVAFVRDLKPEDRVAVASYDARLNIHADFTSDEKILTKALDDVIKFTKGLTEVPSYAGEASILRAIDVDEMVDGTGRIYDALEVLGNALRPIQARKVVAFFSPGIGDASSLSSDIPEMEETLFRPMARALNAANVTVHAIALIPEASFSPIEQNLSRFASETGGEFYTNVVNFKTPLKKLERESSGYYLLSYRAPKHEGGHGYQKIEVRLRNPEFRIRARDGYLY
ncbi:MAG TPA: VWA domain-containing protein [Thermoanaerobaculia bacterium]|nr:VWA domain-containing protein [Thermoanaerobaculia bacterium]